MEGRWRDAAWQARVGTWTADRMAAAGSPPSGPTELVYGGPVSAVFRTPSGDVSLFTKCPIPLFRAEGTITRTLAAVTPAWVPTVIDIEPDEGWLLMADFGSRELGEAPQSMWPGGLAIHAQLQRTWLPRTAELLAAGAERRPVDRIAQAISSLTDEGGIGERPEPALDGAPTSTLPVLRRRLLDACDELDAIGLPDTLVHGDLHPWNVAITDDGLRIFDWSDAAIGPPSIDLAVYLGRARRTERRAILEPWLHAWADVRPRADLERAAELGMVLGAIYQVMTFQQLAGPLAADGVTEFEDADLGWLENAIRALDAGLDARFGFGPDGFSD